MLSISSAEWSSQTWFWVSATGRTAGARVQQPFVYDTHARQGEVDAHGPIMCEQLVLQPQVVVPTAVVAFELGAALVVCLQHERV